MEGKSAFCSESFSVKRTSDMLKMLIVLRLLTVKYMTPKKDLTIIYDKNVWLHLVTRHCSDGRMPRPNAVHIRTELINGPTGDLHHRP